MTVNPAKKPGERAQTLILIKRGVHETRVIDYSCNVKVYIICRYPCGYARGHFYKGNQMTMENRFKKRYESGNTPWDAGQPDFNLIETVNKNPILSCKALDVGCGTGDNSIWLAQNRFQVIGTDISDIAIEKAKEKASKAGVTCDFILVDFLKDNIKGVPFGFIFDRGCFHSFSSEEDRRRFAQNAAAHLKEAGLWLSMVGNADEDRQGPGPPQRTAGDIVLAVEPYFEILSLQSSYFGSNRPNPPRAWRCLMRKRHGTSGTPLKL